MTKEVLQLALEALEEVTNGVGRAYTPPQRLQLVNKAIAAIEAALAQPEPLFAVPVAARKWAALQAEGYKMETLRFARDGKTGTIDDWGKVVWQPEQPEAHLQAISDFGQLQEQEPVAEIVSDVTGCLSTRWYDEWTPNHGDKLYTSPPQREWVGLTDEDHNNLWRAGLSHQDIDLVEAKLKEKNA